MNTIIKFFAKKYIVSIVNDLIDAAKKKVDIKGWKIKVKNVIAFCNLLLETLDDDKISDDEADKIVDAALKLVK